MTPNSSNNEILETITDDTIMNESSRTDCCDYEGVDVSSSSKHFGDRTVVSLSQPNSNFPSKLHIMLYEIHRDHMEHIVSWQQHGRCFIVHDTKEFESKILPRFFQQTKYPSFQRQLSFYGFRRVATGQDKGGYYHECFLRGKPKLASRIRRTKIKGTGPRKSSILEPPPPNFFEMSYLPKETTTLKTIDTEKSDNKVGTKHCEVELNIIRHEKNSDKQHTICSLLTKNNDEDKTAKGSLASSSVDNDNDASKPYKLMMDQAILDLTESSHLSLLQRTDLARSLVAPTTTSQSFLLPSVSEYMESQRLMNSVLQLSSPSLLFLLQKQQHEQQQPTLLNIEYLQQKIAIDNILSFAPLHSHFLDETMTHHSALLSNHSLLLPLRNAQLALVPALQAATATATVSCASNLLHQTMNKKVEQLISNSTLNSTVAKCNRIYRDALLKKI